MNQSCFNPYPEPKNSFPLLALSSEFRILFVPIFGEVL